MTASHPTATRSIISKRTRDYAAKMCSARAAAEAAGIRLTRSSTDAVFDPSQWTELERKLGYAAFVSVIDGGASPREMATNWGEAEARLRTGEFPPAGMERVPGTKPTKAQRYREQMANKAKRRAVKRRSLARWSSEKGDRRSGLAPDRQHSRMGVRR